jgi:bifunctional DNA-binding transcriptional regulator/antitoxin component of YhaV-PrlF toxin-antitoxin module
MPKVHLHGNQLTLPDELRRYLTVAGDDAIDAEEVDEGILLKRSPAAQRAAGLADIRAAQSGVRYAGQEPRPSAEMEEEQIADMLAGKADQPQGEAYEDRRKGRPPRALCHLSDG